MATFTVTVDSYENSPISQVGDGSEITVYGTTIVYTEAMFTTNTTPQYLDIDNDPPFQLKVLSLPINGVLQLNSVPVTINQIITFVDINNGLFTYVPNNAITTAYDDTFDFQIADEPTGIFVG